MVGMELERTISEKGQVVIPEDIRRKLGLKPGSDVIFDIKDGMVVMRPKKNPEDLVEEFCNLPIKSNLKNLNSKKIKNILDEEYDIS
jgi:AbrB family looped-hinge helix DNA binding protein